jgi:hypothetical protein
MFATVWPLSSRPASVFRLGLALLGLVGCADRGGIPENQPVQMRARLESFASCEALESYIEDVAVLDMRAWMERSKPSYRGNWFGNIEWGEDPPSGPPSAHGKGAAGPSNPSGTNKPVDKADFVKNDGTRIFVLSGQKLYLHRSWPAESLRAESSLSLEGWPREMFLHGDKVVVFSEGNEPLPGGGSNGDMMTCPPMGPCGSYGATLTKVTTVDVADLAAPQVEGELYLPGGYHSARLAGGSVRLVMHDPFRWPSGVRWWPEPSPGLYADKARLEKELDTLMEQNEQLIRSRTLADWLPEGRRKRADGSVERVGYDCHDFHKTNAPTRLGIVTVASLNLDSQVEQAPARVSLVTEPGVVYGTESSLYLATPHWWWWPEAEQTEHTYVHKLDLSEPYRASYVASGTVEGYPFSLDEHEGVLRMATTITSRVPEFGNRWGRSTEMTNRVFTFKEEGGQLKLLGKSEELFKGGSLFGAWFMGNKGYVMGREVDPLLTFDLSDPANPRKVGELKVPGYASYIHPVGDTHLLTVGVHVPENGDWRARLKLSLFDVTDLANPREAFTQLVGMASGWSDRRYETKAFNYFPAKGLVAIPFTDWTPTSYTGDYWSNFVSELRVFRVDADTGFTPVGALSMKDVYQTVNYHPWSWYSWNWSYSPHVLRSIMADDYVYAITDAGMRVAHGSNLSQPLVTTHFEPITYTYP